MFQRRRSGPQAESARPETPQQPEDAAEPGPGHGIRLRSLAPEYEEDHHSTYVRHLEAAVLEPRNRNIALTGRYGSGKSSILDEFLAEQQRAKKESLRISISTLGPDEGEDLTNRIQKELVKQLVYRAEPGKVRRSRFARGKDLTWWSSLKDALVVAAVVCGLLWLFGVRPDPDALGADRQGWSMAAFVVLVVAAVWIARWVIGNRLVSQFSTGGTSISFEKTSDSYFDEYLDEIVAFFDATEPDIVVFEDLDRFDDPRIFDSLRELNTLINASAHWDGRDDPLRFVYAIKDSLFERLGGDLPNTGRNAESRAPQGGSNDVTVQLRDAAEAAVERANRTKFFEVVIPVVPFLSHSNARDLLSKALDELGVPQDAQISRGLLDLVARYTTDMRLLINICNEFAVFAQRLLWIPESAPGLTADNLFALVVYKNFHMADFERLTHRGSDLDTLELKRQHLVGDSIRQLQQEKRDLSRVDRLQNERESLARVLSDRLTLLLNVTGHTLGTASAGERSYGPDDVRTAAFWMAVAESGVVSVQLLHLSGHHRRLTFNELKELLPECADPVRWRDPNAEELAARRASIDREVAALRGAGFADLAKDGRFKTDGKTFDEHLEHVLKSELARDLVRRGFVDRYYAEYSAVFYGNFLGVDVANFFRNSVWPNEMDVQAQFRTPDSVRNVLEQAPVGFTSSRSALSIQVVDYMLVHRADLAKEVVAFLVAEHGEDSMAFIGAFLNDADSRKAELVGLLAAHPWRGLLDHLALEDSVPDEATRTALLDAALLSAQDAQEYSLGQGARQLIADRHAELKAFTDEQQGSSIPDVVLAFIQRAGLSVPSLLPLSAGLRRRVVEEGAYELTAQNLRTSLDLDDDAALTLDRIRQDNAVWQRCRKDADEYLDLVCQDNHTDHAVQGAATLGQVLTEQYGDWSDEQIRRLLEVSAPDAALPDITEVPQATWSAIAEARLTVPNVSNFHAYAQALDVDDHLARALIVEPGKPVELEGVEDAAPDVIHALMVRILNASQELDSRDRVQLALQLDPEPQPGLLVATELRPSGDDLLADLLQAGLVPDTVDTFAHFLTGGWRSVSTAFKASTAAQDFLTPQLVAGHVLALLRDPHVPAAIKTKVVADLGAYVTDADGEVLGEAVSFAHGEQIRISLPQVERAAPHATDPEHILWQLAARGNELDGGSAVRILSQLGGDYTGFTRGTGHKFDLPDTDSVKAVLDRLKVVGLVRLPRAVRGRRRVEMA
uniref:YobI family P-loop NTPase n=1 Tax=Pigmentiphaga litoralis TaxID=516702 RepID=UPI003899E759